MTSNQVEECDIDPDDELVLDRVWAELRAQGVKGDPHPKGARPLTAESDPSDPIPKSPS